MDWESRVERSSLMFLKLLQLHEWLCLNELWVHISEEDVIHDIYGIDHTLVI